jgi:ABC-type multidrug transport system fused ATPase/permease subunit
VLDEKVEARPAASFDPKQRGATIRFANVDFAYPARGPLLQRLDLKVADGERVALVGANGSGKTTMLNLLLRFQEPTSGTICINGRDIATVDPWEVRRRIGYVPQTSFLLNGTIRDNIAFGTPDPTDDQIIHAAQLAQATDFIAALPDGLDTVIGDRGSRLSGGQRQRIALARALIKDPPILIFDEATSMFDDEGESGFVDACSNAFGNRTVILVTHRPATLALAHRVLVLADGKLTEVPGEDLAASPNLRAGSSAQVVD